MDNQQQQTSGRTQPGDGAPAHLSVEAARPIETMSREATAERVAPARDDFFVASFELYDCLQRQKSWKLKDCMHRFTVAGSILELAMVEAGAKGGLNK